MSIVSLCLMLAAAQAAAPPKPDLVVFAVDASGTLLVDGWSIRIGSWSGTKIDWGSTVAIDPATGSASFADIAGATCLVAATHRTGETTGAEQVALAAEGGTIHEVQFDGPRPERALIVEVSDPSGSLLTAAQETTLVAVDEGGRELLLGRHPTLEGRYLAYDVAPGLYRIEARDPRFAREVLDAHVPGVTRRALLRGSASLLARFVAADDGTLLQPIDWTLAELRSTPQGLVLSNRRGQASQPSAGGEADGVRLSGISPGSRLTLRATFADHLDAVVEVADLLPHEVREVETTVARGRVVTGRVVDPSGAPVAGVALETELTTEGKSGARMRATATGAVASFSVGRASLTGNVTIVSSGGSASPQPFTSNVVPPMSLATTSDDLGTFRLARVPPELPQLFAVLSPWHVVAVPLDEDGPCHVTAPGRGAADVQIQFASSAASWAYSFSLQVSDGPWSTDLRAPLVDPSSCLRLRGMPEETCRLRVVPRWTDASSAASSSERLLEFVPQAGTPTQVVLDLTDLVPKR